MNVKRDITTIFGGMGNSPGPVLQRLFPPLAATLLLLVAGAGVLLWKQQQRQLTEQIAQQIASTNQELRVDLENQSTGLGIALQAIVASPAVRQALHHGDRNDLLAVAQPICEAMTGESRFRHFYFLDPRRVRLLCLQQLEHRGDRSDHFTAREAERTGRTHRPDRVRHRTRTGGHLYAVGGAASFCRRHAHRLCGSGQGHRGHPASAA